MSKTAAPKMSVKRFRVTLEAEYSASGKMTRGERTMEIAGVDVVMQDMAQSACALIITSADGASIFVKDMASVKECVALEALKGESGGDVAGEVKRRPFGDAVPLRKL